MKFAKELEKDSVPEWRVKYLNYKAGKKYVKAVSKAINRAGGTPHGVARKGDLPPREPPTHSDGRLSTRERHVGAASDGTANVHSAGANLASMRRPDTKPQEIRRSQPTTIPTNGERESLTRSPGNEGNYGSFIPTPPTPSPLAKTESRNPFELPAPALRVPSNASEHPPGHTDALRTSLSRWPTQRSASHDPTGRGTTEPATLPRPNPLSQQYSSPGRLRRIFSTGHHPTRIESFKLGYGVQPMDTLRQREKEFYDFLDSELDKVETFYRLKEEHSGHRLIALREQLHEMRNRRTQEIAEHRRHKQQDEGDAGGSNGQASGYEPLQSWVDPIKSKIFKPGSNSKALSRMPETPVSGANGGDARRDYIRRPHNHDVSYKTAKRKLKLALQEFYRGLELLKSYALLNRTAFRKLNKKYDKAVNARPQLRYMNEKVNRAWFVNSDIVDGHIRAVEDLYARYFEKGNHKIAAGKLRRLNRPAGDQSGIAFRNGLFIGTGAVFTIQGLVYGAQLLFDDDPVVRQQTSYLMQVYGGIFLMICLFALFCVNCYLWTANKINYPFIFEFDTRHSLDWRQLTSFPSFFLLLFSLFFWLNFTRLGADQLYLYYPVILVCISLLIILFPGPILWHRSRKWLIYSHKRLFFAGYYPVEFRDFFLGDMYCSLTYATSNVELFFCLYAHWWDNPSQCNSSTSRLMGFFSALPAVWRALQCIRRYRDTKAVFPHLVNCGKYGMTIMAAIMLSVYRIHGTTANLALFITFSVLNGLYTSIWDLFMDFSLLQPDSRHRFLRDILGLKRRWPYYGIMIIDPVLRFSWIFYAIFTYDRQHSTIVSFLVSLAEVTRRGMWALFRVENEHCANVAQYKASRDVPLPYHLDHEPLVERVSTEGDEGEPANAEVMADVKVSEGAARERQQTGGKAQTSQAQAPSPAAREEGGLRRRIRPEIPRAKSIRNIMADAHTQDFEKKRRPVEPRAMNEGESDDEMIRSDEEEDDDDTGSMMDERMEVRRADRLVRGVSSEDEDV